MVLQRKLGYVFVCCALAAGVPKMRAQSTTVTGRVEVVRQSKVAAKDDSNVVVWLTPLSEVHDLDAAGRAPRHLRLVQTGKHFEPHLLVVPVGAAVEFPNKDPFFHNVFSLFEGKRFDLGLYESGSSRTVYFDKPGISYIFCNIHPQMSAVVIALNTPYYVLSNRSGMITIPDVPAGRYTLHVWYEDALPEELNSLTREVTVSETKHSLGAIALTGKGVMQLGHKNKYGRDYDDPDPATPGYAR